MPFVIMKERVMHFETHHVELIVTKFLVVRSAVKKHRDAVIWVKPRPYILQRTLDRLTDTVRLMSGMSHKNECGTNPALHIAAHNGETAASTLLIAYDVLTDTVRTVVRHPS